MTGSPLTLLMNRAVEFEQYSLREHATCWSDDRMRSDLMCVDTAASMMQTSVAPGSTHSRQHRPNPPSSTALAEPPQVV